LHKWRAMQDVVARIQLAADRGDTGIALVTVPAMEVSALLRVVTPAMLRVGFVPVVASTNLECVLPVEMHHRHLLVICEDAGSIGTTIRWVRALALSSPRAHIVVRLGQHSDAVAPADEVPSAGPPVSARLARADRWLRRGRPRSAERWLVAAAEAARRRADPALAAYVETEVIRGLIASDRIDEAASRVRALVEGDVNWPAYALAAALRADVLIAREDFTLARAWIASLVVEANLRRAAIPVGVRSRMVELDFWQGRSTPDNDPVDHLAAPNPADRACVTDLLGWSALCAWSRGNLARLAGLAARLDATRGPDRPDGPAENDRRAVQWSALLRVLLAASGTQAELGRRVEDLLRSARADPSRRWQRLAIALSARVLIGQGEVANASRLVPLARGPGPEASVCRGLRARMAEAGSPGRCAGTRATRGSPPGIAFLVAGSAQMHVVDGLSGLLAVIEDAEDDAAILSGGCRWVCRQAGATAAAIVSADGGTLVAADGWRRIDLAGEIREILTGASRDVRSHASGPVPHDATGFGVSVRYGGVTIGSVVVRGRPADRAGHQQAALALAALSGSALRARLDALAAAHRSHTTVPEMVGDSPLMVAVRDAIARAAAAPFPILIEGESGTGKELVARALHRLGARRDRQLSAVNCAALTDELVEAELFGHTRGAFTGAVGPRVGLFEEAHGGTLFLDEVTELSPRAQAKLLRVLQEGEVRRVGENVPRAIDVRVIAACNVPLADAVAAGRFRDDLRFRLAVVRIQLPALRDRQEDVPALARLFWRRAATEAGTRAVLGPDALARLTRHQWPGNVREPQNVVAGLVVAAPARGRVSGRHVDQVLTHVASGEVAGVPLESARRSFERRVVAAALVRHAGRRTAAASELGLTRQGLTKALRRLGLAAEDAAEDASAMDNRAGFSAHDDIAGVA